MLSSCPFDHQAAARRRASEPEWRRFPSLWQTLPARKAGLLDSLAQLSTGQSRAVTTAITTVALEQFFAQRAPQALYPYVWVRNALNPVPDANRMHRWLHEVYVSYDASDLPDDAPIRFANGALETLDTDALKFGETSRYGAGAQDLVRKYCAYVHIGPAPRRVTDLVETEPEQEFEAEPSTGPTL
ncbi:hypothetical protein [Massilia orientalis]|uniref:Uncharacterized protein n=1 Tax=Massilia orientalis TaxID=3050128 RepID=A0ACC7MEA6_9BURK|nr:hypothetical protein [Massilia sp. YIM B02787]